MPKKKTTEEIEDEELGTKVEDFVVDNKKSEKKRIAFIVCLVTKKDVLFEYLPGLCTLTPNIWGDKLKIGDTIYLEE